MSFLSVLGSPSGLAVSCLSFMTWRGCLKPFLLYILSRYFCSVAPTSHWGPTLLGPSDRKPWSSQPLSFQRQRGHSVASSPSPGIRLRVIGQRFGLLLRDTHWNLIILLAPLLCPSPALFFLQGLEKWSSVGDVLLKSFLFQIWATTLKLPLLLFSDSPRQ